MFLTGKHVLVTTNSFKAYAGSEIVTFELIEWFIKKGAIVDLFTNIFGKPMSQQVTNYLDSKQLNIYSHFETPEKSINDYAFIWINHSLFPTKLLKELGTSPVIPLMNWHHMGVLPSLESPLLVEAEEALASSITYVSDEVKNNVTQTIRKNSNFLKFDNPVPRNFVEFESHLIQSELSNLLIVSNHLPEELSGAVNILKSQGITVKIAGEFGEKILISPEFLHDFDCVITIGKTVQYALSIGVPVYCYDKFGGCGWILEENLDKEAKFNFSGRSSYRKISSEQIAMEVIKDFKLAQKFAQSHLKSHKLLWNLDNYMKLILEIQPSNNRVLSEIELKKSLNLCKAREESDKAISSLQQHYEGLVVQIENMKISHDKAHEKLYEIQNSPGWKIFSFIKRISKFKTI